MKLQQPRCKEGSLCLVMGFIFLNGPFVLEPKKKHLNYMRDQLLVLVPQSFDFFAFYDEASLYPFQLMSVQTGDRIIIIFAKHSLVNHV
ncbi:hypothetical protein CUMW_103860 [Citrus unshiu]|nr:hypothetical protein CUMW_103860 [Citrus unshiu]